MGKKLSIGKLKKNLWKLISIFIRTKYADKNGYVKCVTCDKKSPWKEMQAGHFVPGGTGNSAKWDTRNIHPQCVGCNIFGRGMWHKYYSFMLEKYGQETINDIIKKSQKELQLKIPHYEEEIERYKKLCKEHL